MLVLGIESSCDETGAALYDTERGLLARHLHTQMAMHAEYGGVVPELASRDHTRRVVPLTQGCLQEAGASYDDIDAVAYTRELGLGGTLLAGSGYANALAFALSKPVIPVHHLEGHLLSPLLAVDKPEFPFVALLVSGGHTQLMAVRGIGDYTLMGESVDDAAGEAFDRAVRLLGLPYPGGAKLSELVKLGNPDASSFPRPMLHSHDLQMSFSGLKTAVLAAVEKVRTENDGEIPEQTRNDICRAFQDTVADVFAAKAKKALLDTGFRTLVVAGGVGTNWKLRDEFSRLSVKKPSEKGKPRPKEEKIKVCFPLMEYCTDNGAMIAFAGTMRLQRRQPAGAFNVKLHWPLSDIVKWGKRLIRFDAVRALCVLKSVEEKSVSSSQEAWRRNAALHRATLNLPFNQELARGTLGHETLCHYVIQDAHYLEAYGRALAVCTAKASDATGILQSAAFAQEAVEVEQQLHNGFTQQFGTTGKQYAETPPTAACHHYTSYLLATAWSENYPAVLACLLPCFWIYTEVGKDIYTQSVPDNPYQAWTDTYAGEEFNESVRRVIAAVDAATAVAATKTARKIHVAYTAAAELEWLL